jgi:hypothetical protein
MEDRPPLKERELVGVHFDSREVPNDAAVAESVRFFGGATSPQESIHLAEKENNIT